MVSTSSAGPEEYLVGEDEKKSRPLSDGEVMVNEHARAF